MNAVASLAAVELGHGLSLFDAALVAALGVYLVDRALELTGKSRSAKTLRSENDDLVRRNGELEGTVQRLEAKIVALEARVDELAKVPDQTTVLDALVAHEEDSERRAQETGPKLDTAVGLLSQIRDRLPVSTVTPTTDGGHA